MPTLASDIMDRAAAFLNDADKELYTYALQLPFLKAANDELGDELANAGIPLQKKVGSYITYMASSSETSLTLPSDLIAPVSLWQRQQTTDDFILMNERVFPDGYTGQDTSYLNYWEWRDQKVLVPPCDTNLQLRLDYIRTLTAFSSSSTAAEVIGSTNFLAYKTAELCARSLGGNEVIGDKMEAKAFKHLEKLLGIGIKKNQIIRKRRRPFRTHRIGSMQ